MLHPIRVWFEKIRVGLLWHANAGRFAAR